jgi:hypothetical protein
LEILLSQFKEELEQDVITSEGLQEKDQFFLDVLFDECKGDVRAAMTMSGYPKSLPTSTITKRLKKEIQERSRDFLVSSTAKASIAIVDLINDPNLPGAKNILAASKEILDRGGVNKEENPTGPIEQNIFILPAKESSESIEEE